jgi:hypothetical protein
VPERTPQDVQRDIEQARDSLAEAVDQLTFRTNPKYVANNAKQSAIAKAQTPAGIAVIAGVGVLVLFLVIRRVRGGEG